MKGIFLIVLCLALLIVGPMLTIWAMNTLFPALAIPYIWQTWAAVILVGISVRGVGHKRSWQ